jgi:hypothetical protein
MVAYNGWGRWDVRVQLNTQFLESASDRIPTRNPASVKGLDHTKGIVIRCTAQEMDAQAALLVPEHMENEMW